MNRVFWCSSCLAMSTRNLISFNKKRECNACQWKREKETIDWSIRKNELSKLLDIHTSSPKKYNYFFLICIIAEIGSTPFISIRQFLRFIEIWSRRWREIFDYILITLKLEKLR